MFYKIRRIDKNKRYVVKPSYTTLLSDDIIYKGGCMYAVFNPKGNGLWSLDPHEVIKIVDDALEEFAEDGDEIMYLNDTISGEWERFVRQAKTQPDDKRYLDRKIHFASEKLKKEDYASTQLPYDLEEGEPECYTKLMNILYSPKELQKIEWAIGSIFEGDSKKIEKCIMLYGGEGSGKSTVINLIEALFKGYYGEFKVGDLCSGKDSFATGDLKLNYLVMVDRDADLSKPRDITDFNKLISHESLKINEKCIRKYDSGRIDSFCFFATNKMAGIFDAKSGLRRRILIVEPQHKTSPLDEDDFYALYNPMLDHELGQIARHCIEVYRRLGKKYYNKDKAQQFDNFTNSIRYFLGHNTEFLTSKYYISFRELSAMYREYCDEWNIHKLPPGQFDDEVSNYFKERLNYEIGRDTHRIDPITNERVHLRNHFGGFRVDMFVKKMNSNEEKPKAKIEDYIPDWLKLTDHDTSILDEVFADCPAQYPSEEGDWLEHKWTNCKTKLKDIDNHKLHHVKVPDVSYIMVDFDLKDTLTGEKSLEKNLKACVEAGFPPTYTEVSKSGNGLHLHYIYDGDPDQLSALFEPGIEQKKYPGNGSVRRMLTKCNDLEIAHIGDGLLKKREKEKKMYNGEAFRDNKDLINRITKCINKEYEEVTSTASNISLIKKMLDDAYESGKTYDVTIMRPSVQFFAAQSTNQANKCLKLVSEMHFKSDNVPDEIKEFDEGKDYGVADWSNVAETAYTFFDLEVYPNKVIICYELNFGPNNHESCCREINPSPEWVEKFVRNNSLIGFNNRMYDNHILYGLMMGYNNQQIYELSQRLVSHDKKSDDKNCYFREAYNLSFGDVYDFASAANKQSLKKWEVELGLDHIEMDIPWDEPLPDDKVEKVAYYCENDVIATRAVFNHLKADWEARKALAKIVGNTPMATTNSLTTQLIFGKNKKPQGEFVYTDLSTIFPGYTFEQTGVGRGKSSYRGEDPSEGGYVYAEPGMYTDVALLDVQSMHPASIIALNLFGDRYTKRFKELRDARVAIKHRDKEALKTLFDGAFAEYAEADDETLTNLSTALKTAINSVYGLTSALFDNPFRDPRNVDNIVAKRGALFMMTLRDEVQKRGFTVVHIKTDSIKIANATQEIIDFCMDFGKQYGYIFEHEATFSKLCLVNKAVLIGKIAGGKHDGEWEAVGAQFQHPFVFKTLFSHEPLTFKDYVEAKSVKTALYIDDNYNLAEGEHHYCFVGKTGGFVAVRPEMLPTASSTSTGCGDLVASREGKDGETKYVSVTGTKGYKWYPSQFAEIFIKDSNGNVKTDAIDMNYYQHLVDDAIDQLNTYGDANWFME